jgi:metal-sulfur cluster biosynthetic enzyme
MPEANDPNRPTWKAETQDAAKAEEIRAALREIIDPEIGLNIIELGLIRDLDLEADQAKVTMILTTPFCPYGPAMLEETRKKISDVAGTSATIEMGAELWEPSMMEEGAGADWGLF